MAVGAEPVLERECPAQPRGRDGDTLSGTFVSQELIVRLPVIDSRPDLRLRLELARRDEFRLSIARPQDESEYGAYNQTILFERFGYGEVATPTIEYEEVLARGESETGAPVGCQTSAVVEPPSARVRR